MHKLRSENTLFYFEDDYCLAICERSRQSQIYNYVWLTALYRQFTERFEGQLEQVFVYPIP